jgi:uncharacterized protein YjiS (DUF1127 family)
MFEKLASRIRERRMYIQTVNELGRLSDRELHDLGIGRGDIRLVARRGASGL